MSGDFLSQYLASQTGLWQGSGQLSACATLIRSRGSDLASSSSMSVRASMLGGSPGPPRTSGDGAIDPLGPAEGAAHHRRRIVDVLWGKDVCVDVENGIHTAVRKVRHALRTILPAIPSFSRRSVEEATASVRPSKW